MNSNWLSDIETVGCCICRSKKSEIISTGKDFDYRTVNDSFTFHKCLDCDHHFLNPRPGPDSLDQIYPKNYGNYSNSAKFSLSFAVKAKMEYFFIRKLFRQGNPPKAILDVGCGDGRLLSIVKKVTSGDATLEGIEISETASLESVNKGFSVKTGSIEEIKLKPDSYDYIFMIQVIEHLHHPREALRKLANSLKKGGLIVIETPDTDCFDFKIFKRRFWGGYHFPRHFNLFDNKNLNNLVTSVGMRVKKSSNKIQPVHWVWSFHHLIEERMGSNSLSLSFNIKNTFWIGIFTILDALQLFIFGKSSNQRIIALKQTNVTND